MRNYFYIIILLYTYCSSTGSKIETEKNDDFYEMTFAPCVCQKSELIHQARQAIILESIKNYKANNKTELEPEIEKNIIEQNESFLYDFSLDTKPKETELEPIVTATGKVNQEKLDQYVKEQMIHKPNRNTNTSEYRSRGLEVIKGFKSDRRKRQTVDEINKNKSIHIYEIRKKD
ncbi:MAG TPA: hypothetical protein PK079_12210 [Leptospiraceae bacterium]|nr:hypothetical protein [Leptospiraceae bacterium]HMX32128.1 hypothetical protein [Leptospiraceae bacterium]HMY31250.1 hypothetical protein [Leptospiraceae bacterium]HMZ66833.1 hypothetical protein [Leptospiraceae bacterium]HNA06132.1 hypothetical protein [Leptospiraceae bacterium]